MLVLRCVLQSVCICLLSRLDCVWKIPHFKLGLYCISVWSCPLCLICRFEVSPVSQPSPFSPVPIIIMIIMIIIIISAQLDAWLREWERSLCLRSEQFASSLRKPVAQKKLRYRICQHCFSLATYWLSYPMKWAACGQFGGQLLCKISSLAWVHEAKLEERRCIWCTS